MTSELWSALVGAFMPIIVELAKARLPTKRWLSYSIALGSSIIIGFGATYLLNGVFELPTILGSIGSAFIAGQSVYNYYWKPAGLDKALEERLK